MAQFALAGLLEDGTIDRHLRRAGRIYTQRYQILRAALAGLSWATPSMPCSGADDIWSGRFE
jgi:DNA-binding transcriptional MocR family regulator